MTYKRKNKGSCSNAPPLGESWIWLSAQMAGSLPMRALGISARRVLDFLIVEHCGEGGAENGTLAAPYRQLQAFGVTKADIRKGIAELEAAGFVETTFQGLRQAGGGDPSRYALTWLPKHAGAPHAQAASERWRKVAFAMGASGVQTPKQARGWLAAAVDSKPRGRNRATDRDIESAPQMMAEDQVHLTGDRKVVSIQGGRR